MFSSESDMFFFTTPETVYFWGRFIPVGEAKDSLENSGHIWDTFETFGGQVFMHDSYQQQGLCFCLMSRRFRKCEWPTLHHGGCCQIASVRLKKGKRIRNLLENQFAIYRITLGVKSYTPGSTNIAGWKMGAPE